MDKKSIGIGFGIGAAFGAVLTYFLLKTKFEQIAQEEIDSVKAEFNKKRDQIQKDISGKALDKPDILEYANKVKKEKYIAMAQKEIEEAKMANNIIAAPYLISVDEFGEEEDFEQETLSLFKDSVLTDSNFEVIEDTNRMIGYNILNPFIKNDEEDVMYVRNSEDKIDYEIVKDDRTFAVVLRELKLDEMDDED